MEFLTLCRHCARRRICRPRGLCWACFYAAGVRQLYPPVSRFGNRGPGNDHRERPLPDSPTCAAPGSESKIAVMLARQAAGQSIFHPADPYKQRTVRPRGVATGKIHTHFAARLAA